MFACSLPLRLKDGWNYLQLNLSQFTERLYGTSYAETIRVSVHANCRLRRLFFSDKLYTENQLPDDFRIMRTVKPREKPAKAVKKALTVKAVSTKAVSAVVAVAATTPTTATKVIAADTEAAVVVAMETMPAMAMETAPAVTMEVVPAVAMESVPAVAMEMASGGDD